MSSETVVPHSSPAAVVAQNPAVPSVIAPQTQLVPSAEQQQHQQQQQQQQQHHHIPITLSAQQQHQLMAAAAVSPQTMQYQGVEVTVQQQPTQATGQAVAQSAGIYQQAVQQHQAVTPMSQLIQPGVATSMAPMPTQVQVIQQPMNPTYLQHMYSAQGPLLMGNVVHQPGISGPIQLLTTPGKPFNAPHMIPGGKTVIQQGQPGFPAAAYATTLPTSSGGAVNGGGTGGGGTLVMLSQANLPLPAQNKPPTADLSKMSPSGNRLPIHKQLTAVSVNSQQQQQQQQQHQQLITSQAGATQPHHHQQQQLPMLASPTGQLIAPLQTFGQMPQGATWGTVPQAFYIRHAPAAVSAAQAGHDASNTAPASMFIQHAAALPQQQQQQAQQQLQQSVQLATDAAAQQQQQQQQQQLRFPTAAAASGVVTSMTGVPHAVQQQQQQHHQQQQQQQQLHVQQAVSHQVGVGQSQSQHAVAVTASVTGKPNIQPKLAVPQRPLILPNMQAGSGVGVAAATGPCAGAAAAGQMRASLPASSAGAAGVGMSPSLRQPTHKVRVKPSSSMTTTATTSGRGATSLRPLTPTQQQIHHQQQQIQQQIQQQQQQQHIQLQQQQQQQMSRAIHAVSIGAATACVNSTAAVTASMSQQGVTPAVSQPATISQLPNTAPVAPLKPRSSPKQKSQKTLTSAPPCSVVSSFQGSQTTSTSATFASQPVVPVVTASVGAVKSPAVSGGPPVPPATCAVISKPSSVAALSRVTAPNNFAVMANVTAASATSTCVTSSSQTLITAGTAGASANGSVSVPASSAPNGTAVNGAPVSSTVTATVHEHKTKVPPPKAMIKPHVLTHVIDGFIIQEASEPFLVGKNLQSGSEKSFAGKENHPEHAEPLEPGNKKSCGARSETCQDNTSTGSSVEPSPRKKQKQTKQQNVGGNNKKQQQQQCVSSEQLSVASDSCQSSAKRRRLVDHTDDASNDDELARGKCAPTPPVSVTGAGLAGDGDAVKQSAIETAEDTAKPNPLTWNVDDVVEFIKKLPGCGDYAEDFGMQEIDGQALMLLRADHLMQAMSIRLGPALKICARIDAMRDNIGAGGANTGAASPSASTAPTN